MNKMENKNLIKANEKSYDEMGDFLEKNGFKLIYKNKKDYWVNGEQKIESNLRNNTLKLINIEYSIKKSLEHIASQEMMRNY